MSIAVGIPVLEAIYVLACGRYLCKRYWRSGNRDSHGWDPATSDEFEPVPRMCRTVLAVYEDDLNNPKWPPEGGYRMDPNAVVRKAGYEDTNGMCPPYMIYVDHQAKDIILAVRGLNLVNNKDYSVLLDNEVGKHQFECGFVHHGLLKSARWLLSKEGETLKDLATKHPTYKLRFAGHSLGSGVVALLTLLIAQDLKEYGIENRDRIRCYAIAPARSMSLNLALQNADIIHSVILQDDFLPRTVTPLEDIFKSIFCLPCHICSRCTKDFFMVEKRLLKDPRRLYTPGRVYHIVNRKTCHCGRYPPIVRTAVPVEGRFEHVVLSCNATQDHSLVWIEKESRKALDLMLDKEKEMTPPPTQKMTRTETIKEENIAALRKAHSLQIPNVYLHISEHSDNNQMANQGKNNEQSSSNVGELSHAADTNITNDKKNEKSANDAKELGQTSSLDAYPCNKNNSDVNLTKTDSDVKCGSGKHETNECRQLASVKEENNSNGT